MADKWQDFGSQKISHWNGDAELILVSPVQKDPSNTYYDYITVNQTGFPDEENKKVFQFSRGTLDLEDHFPNMELAGKSQEDLAFMASMASREEEQEIQMVDKDTLFQNLDGMSVNVKSVVEERSDLGDFISPVNYHDQSKEEKEMILHRIEDMQPGDELVYTFKREDDHAVNGKPVVETARFACVEPGEVLPFTIRKDNLVNEEPMAKTNRMYTLRFASGNDLFHWPNSYQGSETIPMDRLVEIKITKGKFNEEETESLKKGQMIDYNKTFARNEIPNPEEYLKYSLHRTHLPLRDPEEAWEKETRTLSFRDKSYHQIHGEIAETRNAVREEKNKELPKALQELRQTAKEVTHSGLAGQDMAFTCDAIANGLARGDGLDLACTKAEKGHPMTTQYTDVIKEHMESRFPNLNKGLEPIIEKREEKYYLKMTQSDTPKRPKGIQKKVSGKSMER